MEVWRNNVISKTAPVSRAGSPAFGDWQHLAKVRSAEDFLETRSQASGLCTPFSVQSQHTPHMKRVRHRKIPQVKNDLRRLVFQSGDINIKVTHAQQRRKKLLADIFTTLVDIKWGHTLLVFGMSFILEWLFFAGIWWLVVFTHGDLEPTNLADPNRKPCVANIKGFVSCFLFSIETQHTIGYGTRYPTEECPEALVIMCLQSILGIISQAFMVGVVFAKLARPTKRRETVLFSRRAVVCQRDGQLCLMFRVGDLRKTTIIEAHVRAVLVRRRTTPEGEVIPGDLVPLRVGFDGREDRFMFIWPALVIHLITPDSPLYLLSASSLFTERFQIIVTVEGINESTSSALQARTSFLPSDILWGHRFDPILKYSEEAREFVVDFQTFNSTVEVNTVLCSAKDLDEFNKVREKMGKRGG